MGVATEGVSDFAIVGAADDAYKKLACALLAALDRADKLEAALRIADQALTATLNVVQLSEPAEAILSRYRVPLNEAHAGVRTALVAISDEAKP